MSAAKHAVARRAPAKKTARERPAKNAATRAPVKKTAEKPSAKKPAGKALVKQVTSIVEAGHKASSAKQKKVEALLAEIARRKQRIAEDFYDIGVALTQISKEKLYLAVGCKSFDELLRTRNVMNTSSARALIRLVSTMSRDEALAYGQEKAIALLGYAKATPEVDTPKTLMESGKLPGGKPVAKASVRELKQAATVARKKSGAAAPRSPEETAAEFEAKALAKWLRARGAAPIQAIPIRGKDGLLVRIDLSLVASAKLRET